MSHAQPDPTGLSGSVQIGRAETHDLPRLAELMAGSALLARYHTSYPSALASLEAADRAGDTLLMARTEAPGGPDDPGAAGAPIGLAWLSFAPRILGGAAYLRLLLVDAPAQGTGLGSRLLGSVERAARERANHLYLLATVDNHGARRFYARHGYRHVGDLPSLVWPELDEALYHKPLRGLDERLSGETS